jgi:hypothetical protein
MLKSILFSVMLFAITAKAQPNRDQYNRGQATATAAGILNDASVFTVEFWVKTTDNRSNNTYWQRPYLFGNETNGDNSGDFGITINNGYIAMWEGCSSLNSDQNFLSNIRINDDNWHHIAAVNNGKNINLYVDGKIAGSLVSGKRLRTSTAPLTFGGASLDHSFVGNFNNTNFLSQSVFGEARISNMVRYVSNFNPPQSFSQDAGTVEIYHFNSNNSNNGYDHNIGYSTNVNPAVILDPNRPVVVAPDQPINDSYAQPAMIYFNDSTSLNGRLMLGKKDWSFSNEIYIRFFEGPSRKVKYIKPEEIKGFQMGDSYYEPKFLGGGGAINTPLTKTMVRRLTPPGSKMAMYEYQAQTNVKNANGRTECKTTIVYFVQPPGTTDDKVYQFSDNKFTTHFDKRVGDLVQDKPALADKIRSKDKDFFYAQITEESHQLRVWWNIINEYNQQ